jgi:hypothetical protein
MAVVGRGANCPLRGGEGGVGQKEKEVAHERGQKL